MRFQEVHRPEIQFELERDQPREVLKFCNLTLIGHRLRFPTKFRLPLYFKFWVPKPAHLIVPVTTVISIHIRSKHY